MVLNAGRVLTHRQLLSKVWGAEYAEETRTLRVHIVHLREKIEADPTNPRYIHTEPRVGYRFRYTP
jgi:two-component system KDP operon response regulator KdpE